MRMSKLCARTACREPLVANETYFNRSTRGYYCEACAVMLNRVNREDAQRLYNGPLCIKVKEAWFGFCLDPIARKLIGLTVASTEAEVKEKCKTRLVDVQTE